MIVDVAVPYRVGQTFHYSVDLEQSAGLTVGSVVRVALRNRPTHAFVIGFPEHTDIDPAKLKGIQEVLIREPLFDAEMLGFLKWVSEYYCHPLGEVIAAAIPSQALRQKKTTRKSKVTGEIEAMPYSKEKPTLTEEQEFAVARIMDNEGKPILLHGVTGSGKTEVYMHVLEKIVAEGKGAIILVPEIALTPQLLGRFSSRFPNAVAVLHSDLTQKEKSTQWKKVLMGEAQIVVGARSAVFAPVKNLGLIVVDEEHEPSFKQEDSVRYHARDLAVVRAGRIGARVVLGSATPSLESYYNSQNGKYLYVTLKNRVENRPLPKTIFVDLREKGNFYAENTPWLSQTLGNALARALGEKQQSVLYLNRLGFAHFLYCEDCGHSWRCKNCDVALTFYRSPPLLKCHYCGNESRPPHTCDECQGIKLKTMGWGTEQVEKQLQEVFPKARIARMDRGAIKSRADLEGLLHTISRQEIDIVIGTQMIAKGHDFPGISLVGVLMADASLNVPDFRAHERTFQIITQVSGRAGRHQIPGTVVIQSMNPEHPVLRAAAENRSVDYYRNELEARRQFGFPPHVRLAMFRFQHSQLPKVEAFAHQTITFAHREIQKNGLQCLMLGPAEAPLARLNNLYRWQCLVKSKSVKDMQRLLRGVQNWVALQKSTVGFAVDVDPINAM